MLFPATQGETRTESLGVGTGLPDQTVALTSSDVIDGSIQIDVAGQAYSEVSHFLNATAVSKVFVVEATRGKPQIRFGDGIRGQVPPDGAGITATCRVGAATDGNVGAGTVRVNSSGVSFLSGITNPRPATGWAAPSATPNPWSRQAGRPGLAAGSG